jgi:hypothetical protein
VFPFPKLAHTGSYKVHLQTEENLGMIPRAVDQVFRVAEEMKSRGWEYQMEGQFLEIVRLLSHSIFDKLTYARSTTKPSMTSSENTILIKRSTRSSTTLRRVQPE